MSRRVILSIMLGSSEQLMGLRSRRSSRTSSAARYHVNVYTASDTRTETWSTCLHSKCVSHWLSTIRDVQGLPTSSCKTPNHLQRAWLRRSFRCKIESQRCSKAELGRCCTDEYSCSQLDTSMNMEAVCKKLGLNNCSS